jgi:hypothetical protein
MDQAKRWTMDGFLHVQPTTFSDSLNQSMDEACHRQALDEVSTLDDFCTYRFTVNGSRFTCFKLAFMHQSMDDGPSEALDETKCWTIFAPIGSRSTVHVF